MRFTGINPWGMRTAVAALRLLVACALSAHRPLHFRRSRCHPVPFSALSLSAGAMIDKSGNGNCAIIGGAFWDSMGEAFLAHFFFLALHPSALDERASCAAVLSTMPFDFIADHATYLNVTINAFLQEGSTRTRPASGTTSPTCALGGSTGSYAEYGVMPAGLRVCLSIAL